MSSGLVFLTGATGLIGFRVLVFCLQKDYQVRVALRSLSKKTQLLNLTEKWVAKNKPPFDLVHMAPGHVFGPNELVTDPEELLQAGTNRMILKPITGEACASELGVTVHLDDVAEAHVRALDASVPGNRLYILSSGGVEGTKLNDCLEIVARRFPEQVGKTLSNDGSLPTTVFRVDSSVSARLLRIEFIPYERQVRDTVGYYLECVQRKHGSTVVG